MFGITKYLNYSYRREILDSDLENATKYIRGLVLDIGGKKINKRGKFRPPASKFKKWIYLNIDEASLPDILAKAETLSIKSEHVDTIVCTEILEYVAEPVEALQEMYRVLKSGGILILSTPFMHRIDNPSDYWRFSDFWLRNTLERIGFHVIVLKQQGYAFTVILNILKWIIGLIRYRLLKHLIAMVFLPGARLLIHLEGLLSIVRGYEHLKSFTTGFFVIACKEQKDEKIDMGKTGQTINDVL